jgi:sec-independent protein translocase protein TatB
MLDMSWGEVMVIGAVALIVIGPKDLPRTLRTVGQMTAKIRRMAAEFQAQFNEAMREAELDDVKRQIQGMNDSVSSLNKTSFNPIQTIRDEVKGAIEAPVTSSTPVEPAPDGTVAVSNGSAAQADAAPASGNAVPASDPVVALPVPPVPPVDEPAEAVAASLKSYEATLRETPSEPQPTVGQRDASAPASKPNESV